MKFWYLLIGLVLIRVLLPTTDEKTKTKATVTTSPIATETVSLSTTPQGTRDKDQVFLAAIELSASSQAKDWAKTVPDSSKIRVGKEACQAFAQGVTFEQVKLLTIQQIENNPAAIEYVGALIGAGITSYCPQHSHKLP